MNGPKEIPRPRHVAVAIPPSDMAPVVVERARFVAEHFDSWMTLIACVYDPFVAGERFSDSPELQAARADLEQTQMDELERLAAPLREFGLRVQCRTVWHYPVWEGLVQLARECGADMVIAGSFHHGLFERIGMANTDWELVRSCHLPLLLVRDQAVTGYCSILAAVDPVHEHDPDATLDHQIVATARLFATTCDGRVHVVHSYLSAGQMPLLAPAAAAFYGRQAGVDMHREALARLAQEEDINDAAVRLEMGDPRAVIPDMAETYGAHLVVMGSVARSRIKRWLLGSTTESVLDRLKCDVLVVHAGGIPDP